MVKYVYGKKDELESTPYNPKKRGLTIEKASLHTCIHIQTYKRIDKEKGLTNLFQHVSLLALLQDHQSGQP